MAVRDGKIFAVGTTAELRALSPSGTKLVELGGALVLPGFIDSHTHFLAGGFALKSIQLREAKSREDFVARIAAKARELGPGRWILNGDWDHQQFTPVELPRRDWIDAVTPDNPVCVNRLDGHMILANSLALKLAGVTRTTPVPPGGEIVKDPATGEPTGILKDTAMDLVYAKIPEPTFDEKLEAAEASVRHAAENGVTSVHEMADASSLEVFQELARRGRLTTRVHVYIPITEVDTLARLKLKSPFGGPYLKLAGLKAFVDGSLGSATAYFFEPYTDDPKTSGLLQRPDVPRRDHGEADPRGRPGRAPGGHPRHRRPGQQPAHRHVREGRRRERPARPALARRARPAPAAGRYRPLRQARPRRLRPALPRHRRRPLGRRQDRARAGQDDLRVRIPAPGRRGPRLRLGLDGRAARAPSWGSTPR